MMRMLNRWRLIAASLLAVAAFATPALAQDEPRFALVASFPTPTVSFQWDLNDRIGIRFDGSYTYRDESTDGVTGSSSFTDLGRGTVSIVEILTHTESTTHTGSIGVAGLFTVHRTDHLRLYLSPRVLVSVSRQVISETSSTSGLPQGIFFGTSFSSRDESLSRESTSTSPGAGLSFGASSNVFERVALFGEAGFTYSRSDAPLILLPTSISSFNSETSRTTISTRAVAGIMFRF
jgi:hypothetical protein